METLVYFNGGDVCLGCYERTKAAIEQLKARARKKGHTGYLIGHRWHGGQRDRVIVFFQVEPNKAEIRRRRANGFVGARWYGFPKITPGYNRWDNKAGGVVYVPPHREANHA